MDGGRHGNTWTEDGIKALLAEAAETLVKARVSDTGPARFRSCMPPVVRDAWEAYGRADGGRPRLSATEAQLRRLDMVEIWLKALPPIWFRLCWLRAMHDAHIVKMGWRRIGAELNMNHETARYTYGHAVARLVGIANGGITNAEIPLFA